jgi:hypothetical protein
MAGVIQAAALDGHVGRPLEERRQPVGGPRHPRLAEPLVVERQREYLEHVARRRQPGTDVVALWPPLSITFSKIATLCAAAEASIREATEA